MTSPVQLAMNNGQLVTYANMLLSTVEPFDPSEQGCCNIWILWLQGWHTAPVFVRLIAASWIHHNAKEDARVRLIDSTDLPRLLSQEELECVQRFNGRPPAQSDVIRLSLLARYGGIWADATMLCMMPVATWLYPAVLPNGMWMYHGYADGLGPSSWFIVSTKQAYIIQTWHKAMLEELRKAVPQDFFWMDRLFFDLLQRDATFRQHWKATPYIWCDVDGQAHIFMHTDYDRAKILQMVQEQPAFAYKLSRHGLHSDTILQDAKSDRHSDMIFAIKNSLSRPPTFAGGPLAAVSTTLLPLTAPTQVFEPNKEQPIVSWTHDSNVVLMAHFNHKLDIEPVIRACKAHNYELVILDKGNFCCHLPQDVFCRPLRRVSHTLLSFIVAYYTQLPAVITLLPGNNEQWNGFIKLLNEDTNTAGTGPCWNSTFKTTRAKILRHPLTLYKDILQQLQGHNAPEVGPFIERSVLDMLRVRPCETL